MKKKKKFFFSNSAESDDYIIPSGKTSCFLRESLIVALIVTRGIFWILIEEEIEERVVFE